MIRYHARYVVPISAPPIANGTVAVADGRVAYVGDRSGAPTGIDRDLGDVVLMPGLVNAHCHLELTAMRGFLEDLDFRSWILRLTSAKRAVLTPDMLLDAARYGITEGLMRGVTTFADTSDSGVGFDAMIELGVRGIMYQEVFGPDPRQCHDSITELRGKVDRLRPRQTALVRLGVSPHAPYTVSDSLFSSVAAFARSEDLPVAVHIAESELEHALVVRGEGSFADGLRARAIHVAPRARSPVQLLAQTGVLGARPLLIHCVRVDENDIATIASTRCSVAHCPASNAKLGHGIAPVMELLAANVPVGLGSDSVASNNRMDLLEEARLATFFQRARLGTHDRLSAHEALAMLTLRGAAALGLEDETGSLEIGKAADLAAFPLDSAVPTRDPVTAALFALPGSRASFVAVAGRPLVENGALLQADPMLERRVQESADALDRWLGTSRQFENIR